MSFFKNLFKSSKKQKSVELASNEENLSLDHQFVNKFIESKGKFLYCPTWEDVSNNLKNILSENNWETVLCVDKDLKKISENNGISNTNKLNKKYPFFTTCEYLIVYSGGILFSSNQLKEIKLNSFSQDFIVFAKTSQIAKTVGEGMSKIKMRYHKKKIPSNIRAIDNFNPDCKNDDYMNYGASNSKNLYLLLFEDL